MIWSWFNRQDLNITPDNCDWSDALQPILTAFWNALSLFHRSSSLAESLTVGCALTSKFTEGCLSGYSLCSSSFGTTTISPVENAPTRAL